MKTREEIYEEYECSKRRDILDAMEAYATEAIKADRERVAKHAEVRTVYTPVGDYNEVDKQSIINLPIELK